MWSTRSAVTIIFLVLHSEVIVARQLAGHVKEFSRSKLGTKDHKTSDVIYDSLGPVYIGNELVSLYNEGEVEDFSPDGPVSLRSTIAHRNLTKSLSKTQGGKRRLFGLILLLVSLVTTFASVGVDAYVAVKGCAGLYPSLKTFEDQFETKKKELEAKADEIDKLQIKAQDMKKAIEDSSDVMEKIWEEIERISQHQEEILRALDPDIIVAMNNASAKIAGRIRATQGEAEQWSYEKIDAEFEGIFSSATTIVATFGPTLVTVLGPIAKASFKYYKAGKISTTIKAARAKDIIKVAPKASKLLGFTDDVIKANVKATGLLRFASRSSGALKAVKFLKGAGAVLSIVGIGVDIFSIVSTILECKNKRDRAKESLGKLTEAEKEAIDAERELKEFWDEISEFWKENVCQHVRSKSLKEAVKGIHEVVKIAMSQSRDSTQTNRNIQIFLDNIDKAKPVSTLKLLTDLYTSIASVEYSMSCYKNKFSLIGHVVNHCMTGTDTYDNLYQEAQNLFSTGAEECRTKSGVQYSTSAEVRAIVTRAAQKLGFNIECPLNRAELKDQVCSLQREGYSADEVANRMQVARSEVEKIMAKCSHELTPAQKATVCNLRKASLTNKQIAVSLRLDESNVSKVKC